MKRREFLSLSVGLAGMTVSGAASSQTRPCPPGELAVAGSSRATTACGSSGLPDWVPSPGTFADVSLNVPRDVVPRATLQQPAPPYYAVEGPSGVFEDWTSGTFAPEFGESGSYVCWGGGHNGYYGNEVYRFDVSTRLWSRMGEPSPYGGSNIDSIGAYPDGKPAPPHSYQTLGYLSPANGGGTFGSMIQATLPAVDMAGNGRHARWWRFDLASATWSQWLDSSGIAVGALSQKTMVQEPNGNFWWLGSGYVAQIARVSPAGAVAKYSIELNRGYYDGGAVIPGTRIMVLHGTYVSGLETWLLNLPAIESGQGGPTAIKRVFPSGTPAQDEDGLVWCPDRNALASISSSNPATIRWLTPSNLADPWNSSWAWISETYAPIGGAAPGPISNGAFSRFVWVPAIKCHLWASALERRMQAYRPIGT